MTTYLIISILGILFLSFELFQQMRCRFKLQEQNTKHGQMLLYAHRLAQEQHYIIQQHKLLREWQESMANEDF